MSRGGAGAAGGAGAVAPGRRPRRERGVRESLFAVALVLEAVMLIFATLALFGLRSLPAGVALGGGAAFIVVLLIVASQTRHKWAEYLGWALQVALLACGFLDPSMFIVGAIFVGIWIWCFVKARRIERAQAQHNSIHPSRKDTTA
ncbi:DUF4233 domain-containing protein [Schumannella sp. 10F1B-5-1]|uniref:DUF4233 domain-containing protein n=1 Tax=Schumannella sp. 10F1B-5-1 TaxID=2590780 RepID=UPI0011308AAE|nr:DUF4233 domain-containing protein [Schumannella sp. 10F1B-5-1]TPW70155.1 DUF4233 domain-containing protein [Schumannella sp. 10F1B-5-1]